MKIDKSALAFPIATRVRSRRHLEFVGGQPCCVCGWRGVQVHHLLQGPEPKARSEKAGDNWTVPLCVHCHTELHQDGNEAAWAERHRVDLIATAAALWRRSPANKPHGMKCPGESE